MCGVAAIPAAIGAATAIGTAARDKFAQDRAAKRARSDRRSEAARLAREAANPKLEPGKRIGVLENQARSRSRDRASRAFDAQSNIATGSLGLQTEANTQRKKLLGE